MVRINHPVQRRLFRLLPFAVVESRRLLFAQIRRGLRVYLIYLGLFSRFPSDPLGFRSLQARTSTFVSSSFALQFLARTFANADLDVYCNYRDREEVGNWLLGEGYTYAKLQPRS